jgi:hypothetical protein
MRINSIAMENIIFAIYRDVTSGGCISNEGFAKRLAEYVNDYFAGRPLREPKGWKRDIIVGRIKWKDWCQKAILDYRDKTDDELFLKENKLKI